jgi:predicted nucleotidyltransferase
MYLLVSKSGQTRRQITTLIRRYIAALEARGIPVERVILFGSYASGNPDEWSDIDIAVISPKFDTLSLLERYEQLGLANRNLHAPLDVVGFSSTQVTHCEPESFLAEILRTGVDVPVRLRRRAPRQRREEAPVR